MDDPMSCSSCTRTCDSRQYGAKSHMFKCDKWEQESTVIKCQKCEDCAKFVAGCGPGHHACRADVTRVVSPDGWCGGWEEKVHKSGPPKPAESVYPEIGLRIGALVEEKQAAYGDSFGKSGDVMRALYPDGIALDKMADALTVVRIIDKLFRIATDRDELGESPWRDIAGYALLAVARAEKEKAK